MGCQPRFNPDRGKMVKKIGQFPHQFSGTKSSTPSISSSCSVSEGAPHLFRHRQPHGHVSYKQAEGHSVSKTVKSGNRIMELCPEQKPDNFSHPHSREAECPSRPQVKNFQGFHRMDAQFEHFQRNDSQAWSTRHRPICIESEPTDTRVCIMATRAKCGGNWCFQSDMELPSELSVSSIQPDSSVPQKDTERSSRMHSHCSSLEK